MTKELCIIHANCQGEPLLERLQACPEFNDRYECILFTNYIRETVPDDMLGRCGLFLYQYLGSQWDNLASAVLLEKIPKTARSLCIPNMFFTGYWPLWTGREGFDFRCSYLDELVDMGLSSEQTVMLYLRADMGTKFDLVKMVSASIERERERQKWTPVNYVDLIVKNYRDQRLYNTVNHPGSLLMNHAAKGVLAELGFDAPDDATLEALGEPFAEFELPIHPKIADHFGWDFAGPETEYTIYGRQMTFARYAANYVTARKANISDFIGFLQGVHSAI